MATLDLSDNQINGELPDCWKSVNRLLFLDLSNNLLSGTIPISVGTLVKLEALVLRNNSLMGELPSSLKNCSNLIMLDVSENMLSGPIPSWVGERMLQLTILIMRGNHLSGNLPFHLCYLKRIQLLDLSQNKFSEGIPTCVERSFKHPELILQSIDLSCNNFTDSLDLSRNHLSGKIPPTLSNIDRLAVLDLSNNHFSGRIPWGRQLQTFDASSFEGNVDLCGKPLEEICPGDEAVTKSKGEEVDDENDKSVLYGTLYMSLGIGFFTGFWGLLGSLLLWQQWRIAYLRFLNRLIDYILLMIALNIVKCQRRLKD
ncbi:receptor-like protein EIX2 [Vigna unguiculata]|uniref:receptor-like protein EIX2 n=1 Tax=Vigna unguiculata TaxID=3917 RepID=UPI0010170B86|nr:receptor-like protein EIX2 [Vigna unguiculata]